MSLERSLERSLLGIQHVWLVVQRIYECKKIREKFREDFREEYRDEFGDEFGEEF